MYNNDEINQFVDMTKVSSAQSLTREYNKAQTIYGGYQNLQVQANEAKLQTSILNEAKEISKNCAEQIYQQTEILNKTQELTQTNSEQIQKLVECTKQNQISSNRQFWASIIISSVALLIALGSFITSLIQIFR